MQCWCKLYLVLSIPTPVLINWICILWGCVDSLCSKLVKMIYPLTKTFNLLSFLFRISRRVLLCDVTRFPATQRPSLPPLQSQQQRRESLPHDRQPRAISSPRQPIPKRLLLISFLQKQIVYFLWKILINSKNSSLFLHILLDTSITSL